MLNPKTKDKAFRTGWAVIKNNPRLPTKQGARGVGQALNFHNPEILSGFSHRGIPRDLPKPKKAPTKLLPEDDPESEEFDPYKDRGE